MFHSPEADTRALLNDELRIDFEIIGVSKTSRFGGLRQMSVGAVALIEVLLPGLRESRKTSWKSSC